MPELLVVVIANVALAAAIVVVLVLVVRRRRRARAVADATFDGAPVLPAVVVERTHLGWGVGERYA